MRYELSFKNSLMTDQLDISANRQSRKYSPRELIARVLWGVGECLFRFSPRISYGWRRLILSCFGANLGQQVNCHNSARITLPWNLNIGAWSAVGERAVIYNLGEISIGERVTISQGAHLCAGSHEDSDPAFPLLKLPIVIEDDAWICADAFVGPGVTIGKGAVVGARAVVMSNVPAWKVVAGNPARVIRDRVLREEPS